MYYLGTISRHPNCGSFENRTLTILYSNQEKSIAPDPDGLERKRKPAIDLNTGGHPIKLGREHFCFWVRKGREISYLGEHFSLPYSMMLMWRFFSKEVSASKNNSLASGGFGYMALFLRLCFFAWKFNLCNCILYLFRFYLFSCLFDTFYSHSFDKPLHASKFKCHWYFLLRNGGYYSLLDNEANFSFV